MIDRFNTMIVYTLFILCMLFFTSSSKSQTRRATTSNNIYVLYINANWNKQNDVEWIDSLEAHKVDQVCMTHKPSIQKKCGVEVVPTIIIYKNDIEIKRYTADISFKLKATRKEVQEFIDKQ